MKSVFLGRAWILLFLSCCATPGAQFKFPTQTLTVPDGFEVELVAGPPLVERPVSASFDEQGRLYVTDSSGSNDKVDKQLAEKPHRVRRIADTDGDGRFDTSMVFGDHLMFPEGCLWFEQALYISAPPSIWRLSAPDAESPSNHRIEWHQGQTLTGCANDLHGPYLGLDGWIYWCKGAFAKQTYEWPGKKPFVTRAAHIFRARPDHSDMEPVMTGGMDNPVGVVFTPEGEPLLCGTFLMHPEAGKRDGVLHAVYGGVYGKVNDVNEDHKQTGDLLPIMTHLGAAAPCSIIRYESDRFGTDYFNNLFVCCFNMHKISRLVLQPDGATFKTIDSDFLVSDNTDFHPTDVLEDADGSLLVVDTGGWYKLCCPTSQLSKPDVLGAIYRIRRKGAPAVPDARGLQLAWEKLTLEQKAELLADKRFAVRNRAMRELARTGAEAVPSLARIFTSSPSPDVRRDALWTLTRIDSPAARELVRGGLEDQDQTMVHAAIASISLWRDKAATEKLVKLLRSGSPQLQRVSAEALGRIGSRENVPDLLAACARESDRMLEHSLIYALIEIADPIGTAKGLETNESRQKRCALIALDQMDGGGLKPESVASLLGSADPRLRQTAAWIAHHHPEWGTALAGYFQDRLKTGKFSPGDTEELISQIAQFSSSTAIQELFASVLSAPRSPVLSRQIILRSIPRTSFKSIPLNWQAAISGCLRDSNLETVSDAVSAARALSQVKNGPPDFSQDLLLLGTTEGRPDALRLEALAALPAGLSPVPSTLFSFLCANVIPEKPVPVRNAAATVLSKARLSEEQLNDLAEVLRSSGPLELAKLLAAFEQTTNEAVGLKVIAALEASKSRASVRPDALRLLIAKYPEAVQRKGQELLAALKVDTAKQSAHLEEVLGSLHNGDIRRGQALFNSAKTACASCHAMGYLGGHVGPDLTSIGQVRTERDLLESIVYPSASFVRSYEPVVVSTKNEEEYNGLLRKEGSDEVILATGPGTEVRIARADIVDIRPGTVSVMPAGLDEQLSRQELADLLAFLKATKWGAN